MQITASARDGALTAEATIRARFPDAYAKLSQTHQRKAGFVLKHPFQAATMIDETARSAGISAATANRFVRPLGTADTASTAPRPRRS